MEVPFTLGGVTTVLTPTTSRDTDTLTNNQGRIRVYSAGPDIGRIRTGVSSADAAAATTDVPIFPGAIEVFSIPSNHTHVSVICASGSTTVYVTTGIGE
jgi:hypothetical protein